LKRRPALMATLALAAAPLALAAVKPGLEGAQELFRKNHWDEARAHLRAQWSTLPQKDQGAATFLIGRSYVREAELYRALRRVGAEVGLAYMGELTAAKLSRGVAWIPLFTGFYQLEAGKDREAERSLLAVQSQKTVPPEWKASAQLRRAVALYHLGRGPEAAAALQEPGPEARLCRLLATGVAEAPATPPKGRRESLAAAAVLFRAGRASDAERLLAGLDLDAPDAEDASDPKKILRFHDPLLSAAWERICWERAVVSLKPLAMGGVGIEKALAAYYAGLSLFHLGALADAAKLLGDAGPALGPELQPTARLLVAAASWRDKPPAAAELTSLWDATRGQPDAVLVWEELAAGRDPKTEPFASKLDARLKELWLSADEGPSGALIGAWGLARLKRGDDPAVILAALSVHRDASNKNKLEWNDPLLLLALSTANYRDQQYAQSLETLFEMSKALPGLRSLQWNLQGIYAARQTAGGEARISQ
jgi:hypothetical protein